MHMYILLLILVYNAHVFGFRCLNGAQHGFGPLQSACSSESPHNFLEPEDSTILSTLNIVKGPWPRSSDVVEASLDRQERAQEFWERDDIYKRICTQRFLECMREGYDPQKLLSSLKIIIDGPPYANGDAHCGHFLNKTIKDVLLRFLLLQGNLAIFVPGWDCHGMPIENKVLLNFQNELQDYGCDLNDPRVSSKIRAACNNVAMSSLQSQASTFKSCGIWGFWDEYYATSHSYYERMVIDVFMRLKEAGLIYEAMLPQQFSPSCNTVLAEAEVVKEERDITSALVAFELINPKVVKTEASSVRLVVWTTMPWTLVGNAGLAINPNVDYSIYNTILQDNGRIVSYIMANNEHFEVFQEEEKVGTISGRNLIGQGYIDPIFAREYKVHAASFVEPSKGTGIVHLCPAHGIEDFLLLHGGNDTSSCASRGVDGQGRESDSSVNFKLESSDLESLGGVENGKDGRQAGETLQGAENDKRELRNLIDESERYYSGIHPYLDGKSIDAMDSKMLKLLLDDNLLKVHLTSAMVNVDWRSLNRVHVRLTRQWCLDISNKAKLHEKMAQITMYPPSARNYLSSAISQRPRHWCLSRQRVWGTPIPFFTTTKDKAHEYTHPRLVKRPVDGTDQVQFELLTDDMPDYGLGDRIWAKMPLRPNVLDVWFESGLAYKSLNVLVPLILQRLYAASIDALPRRLPEGWYQYFEKCDLKPSYAIEGQDQHRGWYQSSLILHSLLEPDSARSFVDTIITHGFVVDATTGKKLSKSDPDSQVANLNDLIGLYTHSNVDEVDKDAVDTPDDDYYANKPEVGKIKRHATLGTGKETIERDGLIPLDTLRIWACSSDFLQRDIAWSVENLKEARDFEKKLTNFFKFAIANTRGAVGLETDWNLHCGLDIALVHDSFKLLDDVKEHYYTGHLYRVVKALENFISSASRVYLDYIKDRLYVESPHSFARTSAQTSLLTIAKNVHVAASPLVPHMAEDLVEFLYGEGFEKSAFELPWPTKPTNLPRPDAAVNVALELRKAINAARSKVQEFQGARVVTTPMTRATLDYCITRLGIDLRILCKVASIDFDIVDDPNAAENTCDALATDSKGLRSAPKFQVTLFDTQWQKCKR